MLKISRKVPVMPQAVSKTKEGTAFSPSVTVAGFNRGKLYKPERCGNYSGLGYGQMDGPPTEAERWNMPFVNPEFEYDSQTKG